MLEDLLAGLSEADAAAKHGLSERTVQRWLRKGRDDAGGRYGEFAELVDRARIDRELPSDDERPLDEDELLLVVSRLGRRGNVTALALAREILAEQRPPEPSPFDDLDPSRIGPSEGALSRRKRRLLVPGSALRKNGGGAPTVARM